MVQIEIDVNNNRVRWGEHEWQFRRLQSALFFRCLMSNALQGVPTHLNAIQLGKPIGRQQMARLIAELNAFFAANSSLGLSLQVQPRKLTVGPWQLTMRQTLALTDPSTSDTIQSQSPLLLKQGGIETLRQLISSWIVFEGFAVFGEIEPALDMVPVHLQALLSAEANAQLQLRQISFLRRLGRLDEAQDLAHTISANASQLIDTRIYSHAQLALARLAYDFDPATRWPDVIVSMPELPVLQAPSETVAADWHNLMALCSRRAALEAFDKGQRAQGIAHHEQAVNHFQSAMYFGLTLRQWDRVQAFIDNFCYHLQKMYDHKVVAIDEVLQWYSVALACADKLNSGHDDAWDIIFFAEFYLDNASALNQTQSLVHHRSSLPDERYSPNRLEFWDGALERAKAIMGQRQVAITLVLYLRWLLEHQRGNNMAPLRAELKQLIATNQPLYQHLSNDGYGGWLQRFLG